MTNREKKHFLNQYRRLNDDINYKLEECEKWRALAEKITPTISDIPKGQSGGNRTENAIEHIIKLEQEINTQIDRLINVREQIENIIRTVPDYPLQMLLKYRYIAGYTWEEIAVKMNYSYQWVCVLHGRALSQIKTLDSN